MEFLLAALSIGFLGSFHCIGMCGPIALALPLGGETGFKKLTGGLTYHAGRIMTYGFFGLLFGVVGKGFVIGGFQQALSIGTGILILAGILLPRKMKAQVGLTKIMLPAVSKMKSLLSDLIRTKKYSSLFIMGLLNGLLPCGLVYLAVGGALATGDAENGSLFMMSFGAGTLPAMLFVNLASGAISLNWRNRMRKVVPIVVTSMACILILRGMNLGIPYISPELNKSDCTKQSCCHHNK